MIIDISNSSQENINSNLFFLPLIFKSSVYVIIKYRIHRINYGVCNYFRLKNKNFFDLEELNIKAINILYN